MRKFLGALIALALMTSNAFAGVTNGGFSIPDNATSKTTRTFDNGRIKFYKPAEVTGWSTTDTEIEIWSDGASPDGKVIDAPPGYVQFAEVNANTAGTLSQTVADIAVGSTFGFSFYHRGRASASEPDVLKVTVVDPTTGEVLLDRDFKATNVEWIRNAVDLGIKKNDHPLRLSFRAVSSASKNLGIGNFLTGVALGERFLEPPSTSAAVPAVSGARPPSPGGLPSQFQGTGDFYSARSIDGTFDLVRRQEPHPDNPTVTIVTAVAARFAKADTTIEFYARPDRQMVVNGEAMPIPTAEVTLPSGVVIKPLSNRRLVLQHEGREVLVIVRPRTASHGLRYQPEFKYRGGLMINMDEDGATDLASPEGRTLTLPADATRIAEFGGAGPIASNETVLSRPLVTEPRAAAPKPPAPAAAVPAAPAPASSSPGGAGLFLPGEELQRGSLYAMNGHHLTFQADGNLCVYTDAKRFVWCMNNDKSVRYQASSRVVFTREGVLSVTDANNQTVWRQPANGAVLSSKVEITAQGALQIVGPGNNVIWSSSQR